MIRYTRNSIQRGLSLVELMVAMGLGLVLSLGVLQLFVANRTTLDLQEGMAHIQETGRYVINRIGKSVHGAGYFGCTGPVNVKPKLIAVLNSNLPEWDLEEITEATAVSGLNNVSTGNAYKAASGTDVLILRGSGDDGIGIVGVETAKDDDIEITSGLSAFYEGNLVMITDCSASNLLRATGNGTPIKLAIKCENDTTCNGENELTTPFDKYAYVVKPYIHAFFIKDTTRNNSSGHDIFSLYIRNINGTNTEIAEGVSNMQVTYGLDQIDDDSAADIYKTAAQVTTANAWDKVVSIKISLLLDSVENSLPKSSDYEFMGITRTPTTTGDNRIRQEFSGFFSLRNRTL